MPEHENGSSDGRLLVFATRDGYLFWGESAIDVVDKMRKSEFSVEPHGTNRKYIRAIARRIREQHGAQAANGIAAMNEDDFIQALVGLGLVSVVERPATCPLAHTVCLQQQPSCFRPNATCWLMKVEGE